MKKRIISMLCVLVFLTGCTHENLPDSGNSNYDLEEKAAQVFTSQAEAKQYLIEEYGITEETLEGYNVISLISEYQIQERDYSKEEILEIIDSTREIYIDDGAYDIFWFMEEDVKTERQLKRDDRISKIGFSRDMGSSPRSVTVVDLENKVLYFDNDVTKHEFQSEPALATDIYAMCDWTQHYEQADSSTASVGWSIICLLDDGTVCGTDVFYQSQKIEIAGSDAIWDDLDELVREVN